MLWKTCFVRRICTKRIKAITCVLQRCQLQKLTRQTMSTNHSSIRNGETKKYTICVEGNIASGKTAFLNYFCGTPDVEVLEEPVDKWRNVRGENVLGKMYEDQTRWSLTLQTYVQLTMLQSHLLPQEKHLRLMERSIFSAKYCFVENLHNSGKMPEVEYAVLTEWFDWITSYYKLPIDLIVYLQTTPKTVYDRIMKRGRKEERKLPIEYLEQLHELHEDWLIHQSKYKLPCKVLVLDANTENLQEMYKMIEKNRSKILCA